MGWWILSAVLALLFLGAGLAKAMAGRETLAANPRMAWVQDFSDAGVRGIGAAEALGAIGLVAPWLTGIVRVLTPLAATGLALTMIGATVVHARRGEKESLPITGVLFLLCAVLAAARFAQL